MDAGTIVALNYLPFARVLASSFHEFNQGEFHVLVIDDVERTIDSRNEPFTVWHLPEIGLASDEAHTMTAIYGVTELATAVKPWFLAHLLSLGSESVTYFDPDIRIYGALEDLALLAASEALVLTPHTLKPMARDDRRPSEADILSSGIYNLGFLAVGRQSGDLLSWWQDHLRRDAVIDPERQLFTDQRWMDFAPGYFAHVILRDPGCNVAYWNVDQRPLAEVDGTVTAGGAPLRFFHFSGYDPDQPSVFSKHQLDNPRVLLSRDPLLRRLCDEYGRSLFDAGYGARRRSYGYDHLPSGMMLDRSMRKLYRQALIDHEQLGADLPPDPFFDEPAFCEWLAAPIHPPRKPVIPRYLYGLYESRADLRDTFPDLSGPDAEHLLQWAATSGPSEIPLPLRSLIAPRNPTPALSQLGSVGLERGINVAGYFKTESGVGELGRLLIKAIESAGIPHRTLVSSAAVGRQLHPFTDTESEAEYDTNILSINADQTPVFARDVGKYFFDGHYTIGLWAWELEDFPRSQWPAFEFVDEVWALSDWLRGALDKVSPKPVFSFPVPVLPPEIDPDFHLSDLGLSDRPTFLFLFDYLSIVERKNPYALIDAFSAAFRPDEGPRLIIKTINGEQRLAQHERLLHYADRSDIVIIDQYLNVPQKNALIASCDCYVSLHRSEGFGFTLAEAMALARPVIATNYSANTEFMSEANSYLVPYAKERVPLGCEPYPHTAYWAAPDILAAADLMRQVYDEPERASERGAAAQSEILRRTPERAAAFVRDRFAATAGSRRRTKIHAPSSPSGGSTSMGRPTFFAPTRFGPISVAARKTLFRTLRFYDNYRNEIDRGLRAELEALEASLRTRTEALDARTEALDARTEALDQRVSQEIESLVVRLVAQNNSASEVSELVHRIRAELDAIPYMTDPTSLMVTDSNGEYRLGFVQQQGAQHDASYASFEDLFRGSEEFISTRLERYLPLVSNAAPLVEIGPGRGEFLSLLRALDLESVGVEIDGSMVERCQRSGLNVVEDDAVNWLSHADDNSLGCIFSAQVIEHLPYEHLLDLLRLARLKLRPGGLFIAETVNPYSYPALKTFWVDLTHQKPIFPEVLLQLLREIGFAEGEVIFPNGAGVLSTDRTSQGEYAVIARC
jgi:glycosyltransferase involved in cell wall biosynthesis